MDSPFFNQTRAPRPSFLSPGDEPVEDNEFYDWARKNNKLTPRRGSTIIKIADPNAPGGFRYVARQNAESGLTGGIRQGEMAAMPTDSGDQLGEVVVSSKDRVPSFLSRKAAAPMAADYQKYKDKAAFEEARALRIAEEGRQDTRTSTLADADMERRLRFAKEIRDSDPNKPIQDLAVKGKVNELTEAEEYRKSKLARKESFLNGGDIPGMSKSGENAARAALLAGRPLEDAEQIGQREHDAEVSKIQKYEEGGNPDEIAEAERLRTTDADLGSAPSRRSQMNEDTFKASEDEAIGSAVQKFASGDLKTIADKESWAGGYDNWEDYSDDDMQKMAGGLQSVVRAMRTRRPGLSLGKILDIAGERLRAAGHPPAMVEMLLQNVR